MQRGRRPKGLAALLEGGADPALADSSGDLVHYAAKTNVPVYLDILLKHGADANTPNGVTRAGADPRATNKRGTTFQKYLDMTPTDLLHDEARHQRESVHAWVREHQ